MMQSFFQATSTSNKPSPISDKDRRTDGQAYSSTLTGDVFDTKKVTGLWLQQQHKCCIGMLAHGEKSFNLFVFFCLNSPTMLWKNSGQGVKACFYNAETTLCFPCRSSLIVNLMKSHRLFMVRLGCTRRGAVVQEAIGTYNCSIVAMQ